MDFHITLDITDRFADALNALARTIQSVSIQATPAPIHEPLVYSVEIPNAQPAQMAPAPASEPEVPVTQSAIKIAEPAVIEPQETAITETPANDDATAVEPAPEKPKKKKASKRPVEAPEPAPVPEAPVTQPAPEPVATAPTAPQETAKSDGDPMAGMTVVDAVQALVSEIQDKGIDMASVNARVRAKANEIGLTYASAACLIKAIGYVEARRVALGEK